MGKANSTTRLQKKYVGLFKKAGAVAPTNTVNPKELGLADDALFRRMVSKGIFVRKGKNRYFMNMKVAEKNQLLSNKWGFPLFLALGIILIVILLILI